MRPADNFRGSPEYDALVASIRAEITRLARPKPRWDRALVTFLFGVVLGVIAGMWVGA